MQAACARTVRADLPGRKGGRGLSCRVPTTLDSRPLYLSRCYAAMPAHREGVHARVRARVRARSVLSISLGAFLDSASLGLTRRGVVWPGVASIVRHCSEGVLRWEHVMKNVDEIILMEIRFRILGILLYGLRRICEFFLVSPFSYERWYDFMDNTFLASFSFLF